MFPIVLQDSDGRQKRGQTIVLDTGFTLGEDATGHPLIGGGGGSGGVLTGTGSPNGVINAAPGTRYCQLDVAAGKNPLWVKTDDGLPITSTFTETTLIAGDDFSGPDDADLIGRPLAGIGGQGAVGTWALFPGYGGTWSLASGQVTGNTQLYVDGLTLPSADYTVVATVDWTSGGDFYLEGRYSINISESGYFLFFEPFSTGYMELQAWGAGGFLASVLSTPPNPATLKLRMNGTTIQCWDGDPLNTVNVTDSSFTASGGVGAFLGTNIRLTSFAVYANTVTTPAYNNTGWVWAETYWEPPIIVSTTTPSGTAPTGTIWCKV